ncbi:MAG: hypothetical protein KDK02_05755 [Rhodobacteraceae bacterium]|nr:hypothetical protein [Paracoccaceae bacterium]
MTEISVSKLADRVAQKAEGLAVQANTVAFLTEGMSVEEINSETAEILLRAMEENERAICFWFEQFKKAFAK